MTQVMTMALVLFGGGILMGATLLAWVVVGSFERRAVARYRAREAEAQQVLEQRWAEVAAAVVEALGPVLAQLHRDRRTEPCCGGWPPSSAWESPSRTWSDGPTDSGPSDAAEQAGEL